MYVIMEEDWFNGKQIIGVYPTLHTLVKGLKELCESDESEEGESESDYEITIFYGSNLRSYKRIRTSSNFMNLYVYYQNILRKEILMRKFSINNDTHRLIKSYLYR